MSKADDFIRSTGNMAFVNLFLKYAVFVLGLVCLGLTVSLVLLARHVGEVKPLPIFVNAVTGEAKPVDFKAIDAQGRERLPVEVEAFVREYLGCLYTFTRLTVRSNLDEAFARTAPEAQSQVRLFADLAGRAEAIARSGQGLVQVQNVSILQSSPNLAIQAIFRKTALNYNDEVAKEQKCTAVLKLKVVARTVANAHGLVVVEYNESPFEEENR